MTRHQPWTVDSRGHRDALSRERALRVSRFLSVTCTFAKSCATARSAVHAVHASTLSTCPPSATTLDHAQELPELPTSTAGPPSTGSERMVADPWNCAMVADPWNCALSGWGSGGRGLGIGAAPAGSAAGGGVSRALAAPAFPQVTGPFCGSAAIVNRTVEVGS